MMFLTPTPIFIPTPQEPRDPNQPPLKPHEFLLMLGMVILACLILIFLTDVVSDWLTEDKKTLFQILKEHLREARHMILHRIF